MSTQDEKPEESGKRMSENAILRRLDFILNEARSKDGFRDQTVTFAMRVISNWCTPGKDAGALDVKLKGRRMSREAYNLASRHADPRAWSKETINEHQKPLAQFWSRICEDKSLSREQLLADFREWLMVTVTKAEDDKVRKLRDKDPVERYRLAGIEVGEIDEAGNWQPFAQNPPVYLPDF